MDTRAVNAIRILSADAIQKAHSGHPGFPLGAAPLTYELWAYNMKHNPANPDWIDRDRFILSGGHASMLLYSLLHLFGYGNLAIDDLKQFRQLDSLTPGHPEYRHTVGIEATTGPLGAGMGMAVGMAMAEEHLAEVFNKDGYNIIDHYTYALGGDGCMMEGISSEVFSLAGTLGLSKLIVLYDSNNITIEGSTDIAFKEDVMLRMQAFGFQTIEVHDGNDLAAIGRAIEEAKSCKDKPSFIKINTLIGYGCPDKQGKANAHGEPLGVENIAAMRKNLAWESEEAFYVPEEIYEHYRKLSREHAKAEAAWQSLFKEYMLKYPEQKSLWDIYFGEFDSKTLDSEEFWTWDDKADATRNISGKVINRLKDIMPNLIGGSADLAPSNKTLMNGEGDYSPENYRGRNLHFGVRELGMTAVSNGIILHGGLRAYCATFFVFSDYTKPMARLASLMQLPSIFVFTHDSIGVGEDGPTHEPVEQMAMLRAMPNFHAFRPADARETIAGWYAAINSTSTPTALVLTRQALPQLEGSGRDALKGAYIIREASGSEPDIIMMASGSEVSLALKAADKLAEKNISVRVVSAPCLDIFEEQSEEYKESVLPKHIRKRVAIEALSGFGWERYTGIDGKVLCMQSFGASAPQDKLFEKFGFTVEHVVKIAESL